MRFRLAAKASSCRSPTGESRTVRSPEPARATKTSCAAIHSCIAPFAARSASTSCSSWSAIELNASASSPSSSRDVTLARRSKSPSASAAASREAPKPVGDARGHDPDDRERDDQSETADDEQDHAIGSHAAHEGGVGFSGSIPVHRRKLVQRARHVDGQALQVGPRRLRGLDIARFRRRDRLVSELLVSGIGRLERHDAVVDPAVGIRVDRRQRVADLLVVADDLELHRIPGLRIGLVDQPQCLRVIRHGIARHERDSPHAHEVVPVDVVQARLDLA